MHVLIPIIAGAAYKAGCKIWQDHQRATARTSNSYVAQPEWTSTIRCSHTPEQACALIDRYLIKNGAELRQRTDSISLYSRGNPSITQLPTEQDVPWVEIPVWIGFGHGMIAEDGSTLVTVDFRPFSTTKFLAQAPDEFRQLASEEFELIIDYLNTAQEPTNGSPPKPDDDLLADFEALGLAIGATWQQVQAAYRELSRKYHPDIIGKDIDAHLVELAQQRFSQVASAYQRLRSRLSDAA